MKFTIEIDPEINPNAVGEYLRSEFFAEDPDEAFSIGCFSVFEWREGVESLVNLPLSCGDEGCGPGAFWTRGLKDDIECRYYWDGDGTLAFRLPDGKWLVNHDCKKDHEWELVDSESYL